MDFNEVVKYLPWIMLIAGVAMYMTNKELDAAASAPIGCATGSCNLGGGVG